MTLYHISEEVNIKIFDPRPIQINNYKIEGNAVWAIDGEHLVNYMLPRDCPRVTFYAGDKTTKPDIDKFFKDTYAARIIAIESLWIERILNQRLIQYEFDDSKFTCIDETAGYFISRDPVTPIKETIIENPVLKILGTNTELRVMPLLWKLREEVINSTLEFSIIRMRNAQSPPEGIEQFYPVSK
jgi:hypothetical protein